MPAWSAPVRFAECDQQGIVFHAHYLTYADEAVVHVWRQQGVSYADLLARGLDTAVVASELQWSSAARWGDVVDVDGVVEKVGRTSFVVALTISVGERLCCRVRTTYVLTDLDRKPTRVPDDVRALWSQEARAAPGAVGELGPTSGPLRSTDPARGSKDGSQEKSG